MRKRDNRRARDRAAFGIDILLIAVMDDDKVVEALKAAPHIRGETRNQHHSALVRIILDAMGDELERRQKPGRR